jgi:hemin uptake protein HemP
MDSQQQPQPRSDAAATPSEREIDSAFLMGTRPEIRIRHNDLVYTLRRTRQGKLILTK